jgi:hypothetical protein
MQGFQRAVLIISMFLITYSTRIFMNISYKFGYLKVAEIINYDSQNNV